MTRTRIRSAIHTLAVAGILCLAATVVPTRSAQAQEAEADSVAMMMEMMGPTFGLMMTGMMEAMMTVLEQPETAERLATFARNYYDALIRRGFSEEQALRLVVAIGFPALGGGG